MLKKLTRFQKQLIAVVAVLVLSAVLFAVYFIRAPKNEGEDAASEESRVEKIVFDYGFSDEETEAIKGFGGTAEFAFSAEKGKADSFVAPLMALADDYAKLNENIKVSFGKGDKEMTLTVNGTETVIDPRADGMFLLLEDGTPYAFSARPIINTALFGNTLGVADAEPIKGYDMDGDVINVAGYVELFTLGESVKDLEYVVLNNEHGETTLYVIDGNVFVNDIKGMDVNSNAAMFLLSFSRAPVAVGKVENPEDLAAYGLDSDENAAGTLLVGDTKENYHYIRIGNIIPNGTGRYMLCDDREHVYISNAYVEYALQSTEAFLGATYGEALASAEKVYDAIDDITIDFGDETMQIKKLTDEERKKYTLNYSWKVMSPERFVDDKTGYALSNYYRIASLFYLQESSGAASEKGLTNMSTTNIVAAKATDETIAQYGLDKPYRVFSWVQSEKVRCTIYVGYPDGKNNMYVYGTKETLDKKDGEYTVKDTVTLGIGVINLQNYPGITMEPVEYVNDTLYAEFASSISYMVFERGDETHKISFIKNSEGKVDSAKLDGKAVDRQSALYVYRDIISCSILGEYDGEVPEPDLTVTINKDGEETVLTFARVTTVKVYCTVNGKGGYYMSYSEFETLLKDYETLISGKIIPR